MEKLVFRKFFIDTINFFLISSLSLSLIVWVIQAVNYLDFVSEDGHSFKVYFYYTLLNFPKIFSRLIVFMFFLSIFYTILKYLLFHYFYWGCCCSHQYQPYICWIQGRRHLLPTHKIKLMN